jgi:hypothetical protein
MRRFIALKLFSSLISLLLLGPARAWDHPQTADILAMTVAGVVKIDVFGAPDDPRTDPVDHGSGFVLTGDGFVETAAHLFLPSFHVQRIQGRLANVLSPKDNDPNTVPLTLVNIDYGHDTALLHFTNLPNGMRALPISSHSLQLGDTLYVFGFPGGQNTPTTYLVKFESRLTPHRFQFQGISNAGNSGGPLLDKDGFVVGIDSRDEHVILGSPVTGTYQAVPVVDFLLPPNFEPSQVRPLFFRADNFNDPLVRRRYPNWSDDAVSSVLASWATDRQPRACNMALNKDWRLIKLDTGFIIEPPIGGALGDAEFQMSLSIARIPEYLSSILSGIQSRRYLPIPFNFLPLESASILLLNPNDSPTTQHPLKRIAVEFHEGHGLFQILRYLPRTFNEYQYNPNNADAEMAICTVKNSVPINLLMTLCEPFMMQTVHDHITNDNPCVPGDRPHK